MSDMQTHLLLLRLLDLWEEKACLLETKVCKSKIPIFFGLPVMFVVKSTYSVQGLQQLLISFQQDFPL